MISVYITTRNRRDMLERAITSVLKQTKPAKEIIIVDDASTDDTEEYIKELRDSHPSIIYIKNTVCEGAQVSRNKAISIATQDYITGLDDDDEFLPNRLERLYNAYITDLSTSFICDHIITNTGSKKLYSNKYIGIIDIQRALDFNIVGSQVFTKRKYLLDINGFDTLFPAWQDYDTWIRLIKKFGPGKKIKGASYIQHTSHDKERITNSGKHNIAFEIFIKKHRDVMSKGNLISLLALVKMLSNERNNITTILKLIYHGKLKRALSVIKSNITLSKKT